MLKNELKNTQAHFFFDLANELTALLDENEKYSFTLHGEDSSFTRLNHGKIRQSGDIKQRVLELTLVQGTKQVKSSWSSSNDKMNELIKLKKHLIRARFDLKMVTDDPHLQLAGAQKSIVDTAENKLLSTNLIVKTIVKETQNLDLVGVLAAGEVHRGFANDDGVRSFFSQNSFQFDYSLFLTGDKAVKRSLGGTFFDTAELKKDLDAARQELKNLARPAITLKPQKVRAYLAPAAVAELLSLMSSDGFSLKEHRTKNAALLAMSEGKKTLHKSVTLIEDLQGGVGPRFSDAGFETPAQVQLICAGKYTSSLVSPRSAKEYGVKTNGAQTSEAPTALLLQGGTLDDKNVLRELGTGVYINNLWYCNFSDKQNAGVTGMTRFASFWVENGDIKGPLNVMRFDDSLYDLLGTQLLALTQTPKWMLDTDTYSERKTHSIRCPGVLVREMNFTL